MTSSQAKRWLSGMTIVARVWCVAFPTILVLTLAGVITILCLAAFVAATFAGLLFLATVVAIIERKTPKKGVKVSRQPTIYYGDNEMWKSPTLRSRDVELIDPRASGIFDEPHHPVVESHMSITVFDLNADGTTNFMGTGVCSSGLRDIEM